MNVKFIASVSMIARDPVKSRKLYVDTLGLPLQQLEGDFYASEHVEGSKHFGVWPLSRAAEACFGTSDWPADTILLAPNLGQTVGLSVDSSVGQCVDAGEPTRQLLAEAVASGQRGGCRIADLGLAFVVPDQNFEGQIKRGGGCCEHHGRARRGTAEDDDLGISQLESDGFRLAAVIDYPEHLQSPGCRHRQKARQRIRSRPWTQLRDKSAASVRHPESLGPLTARRWQHV
jgi:catechol 2,3-dioxygenase-like lactoylglutathione lyase family enzyme